MGFFVPSFASQMVAKYETLISQCVGVASINVDGQQVEYVELERQYLFWKSRAARENGSRPRVAQHYLGGYR